MASNGGRTDPPIAEALFDRGYEFEFFQAARLLARLFPHRKPVGSTAKPEEEFARFITVTNGDGLDQARLSMAFPASAVHDIQHTPDSPDPARMTVAFMGLTGVQGVLPFLYTERLLARKAAKDNVLAAFFDLFNHRIVSLFYRAWQKHRPAVLYEIAATRGEQPDTFTQYLFDLIGMGTRALRGRLMIRDESLLLYAGLIAQRPHSAMALRGILLDYFSLPIEIDQYVGSWYELEDSDRCYLSSEGKRNQLGEGAFLGAEIWDQQARFRIRVGPVSLERFKEFLPNTRSMAKLVELTRFIAGEAMVFDVQMFLRAQEVPYCRLEDDTLDAPRLGWMSWLKTGPFEADAGDTVSTWIS
jgi:type VI secretion system protein ImpH